jgi:hypothetical protein
MSDTSIPAEKIEGVVTARPCDCCGHHEIGIVVGSGEYLPLRPGIRVRIIHQPGQKGDDFKR